MSASSANAILPLVVETYRWGITNQVVIKDQLYPLASEFAEIYRSSSTFLDGAVQRQSRWQILDVLKSVFTLDHPESSAIRTILVGSRCESVVFEPE